MLRDKNLIPLSHQHQRALALCVRIDRASPIPDADLPAWQAEATQLFRSEITIHFAAEEQVIFPAAAKFVEVTGLIDDLHADHAWLRAQFLRADSLDAGDLNALAARLSAHIRKEERHLFERMQQLMTREELALLGEKLNDALKDATQECALPSAATKLRPAKPA
jgi:iron-sulfur cluster repair protein YtfE (RIC family)